MELLNELLEIKSQLDFSMLLEDLGKLKDLGVGRMINAFKQSYQTYDHGRGQSRRTGIRASEIGKNLHRYSGVGPNSEAVEVPKVSSWATVKKAFKANEASRAAIFYVDGKAIVLLICDTYDISTNSRAAGLSWDLNGVGCTPSEINNITSTLSDNTESSYSTKKVIHDNDKSTPKATSRHTIEKHESGWKAEPDKIVAQHYQGVAQYVRTVGLFFDELFKVFGPRIKMKILTSDSEAMKTRGDRSRNRPMERTEISLFSDSLRVRLAKYKNTKVQSVDDMRTFIEKVFSREAKKLKFAGATYTAMPRERTLGSNNSYKHEKTYRNYTDKTMQNLIMGKEVSMEFDADQAAGEYHTLYVFVKFKDGTLVPTKAKYWDVEKKTYVEETL